jgi:hypothetical protein
MTVAIHPPTPTVQPQFKESLISTTLDTFIAFSFMSLKNNVFS